MNQASAGPSAKGRYVDPVEFTPEFAWKKTREGEEVFCEGVPLTAVEEKFGTPTYLYSQAALEGAYREFDLGLGGIAHTICFAVKSNGNLSLLELLAKRGSGFDIVSRGELRQLEHLGVRHSIPAGGDRAASAEYCCITWSRKRSSKSCLPRRGDRWIGAARCPRSQFA